MKTLLLLLFIVLMTTVCVGQAFRVLNDDVPVGRVDTVPVLLAVVDTCRADWSLHMTKGYAVSVRRKWRDAPGTYCTDCPNYWEFVMFLDKKKKPLSHCITVWQSK